MRVSGSVPSNVPVQEGNKKQAGQAPDGGRTAHYMIRKGGSQEDSGFTIHSRSGCRPDGAGGLAQHADRSGSSGSAFNEALAEILSKFCNESASSSGSSSPSRLATPTSSTPLTDPFSDAYSDPLINPAYQQAVADASGANGDNMSFEQVVTTLGRHEDLLKKPLDQKGIEKLINDPATPSDAQQALQALLKNPQMLTAIDSAKEGKSDGKISAKDIRTLQQEPRFKEYAMVKAESYTHAYVPSDAKPGSPAREMTDNDAMRELYLYSESLSKNVNMETLQKIADGSQDMGKCPPQVAAAAKYFVDNPEKWQQLTGKNDPKASVSRDRLCDLAAYNVKLSPQESKALNTLKNNEDIFFKGGGINPDKLKKIAEDTGNSQEVREAASLLSQPNSMLFSMLDNGKHGAGGNFFNKANDHNISKGDLNAFISKGSNQVAPPARLSPASSGDPLAQAAKQEMDIGQETQPDAKKTKGGGFFKFLDIFTSVAMALIPGIGALAGSALAVGRAVVTTAIKEGIKAGAKEGSKAAAKQEVKNEAKNTFKDELKQGVKDGVKDGIKDGVKDGTREYASNEANSSPSGSDAPTVWAQS